MIIVDFMHLSFKSLYVALGKDAYSKNKVNFSEHKGMFVHLIFNYLKLIQNELVKDYDDKLSEVSDDVLEVISDLANSDIRQALNILELCFSISESIT